MAVVVVSTAKVMIGKMIGIVLATWATTAGLITAVAKVLAVFAIIMAKVVRFTVRQQW